MSTSFQDIIAQHNAEMAQLNKSTDASRNQFVRSVEQLTETTLSDISAVSKKTYNTQKQIEAEAIKLHEKAQTISQQSKDWAANLKDFNNAVKELGDVANWASVIESDMTFIAKALDNTVTLTAKPTQ